MQARIVDWLSDENLTAALGKSRTEIFDLFGNDLEPIAYIPSQYLPLISKDIKDPRIYCGMGYFIDHALRNHGLDGTQATIEDVDVSKYLNIQAVLDNPDAIKETFVDGKRTVVFVKKIGRYFAELTQVEEDGKVILHKSLFSQKKEPYAKLNDIRSENSSSEGGTSSIGHAAEATPAISLQSRGDDMSDTSDGKDTQATPYVQAPAAENAENASGEKGSGSATRALDGVKEMIAATARREHVDDGAFRKLVESLTYDELKDALEFADKKKGRSKTDRENIGFLRDIIKYMQDEMEYAQDTDAAEMKGYEYIMELSLSYPSDFDFADYAKSKERDVADYDRRGHVGHAALNRGILRAAMELQTKASAHEQDVQAPVEKNEQLNEKERSATSSAHERDVQTPATGNEQLNEKERRAKEAVEALRIKAISIPGITVFEFVPNYYKDGSGAVVYGTKTRRNVIQVNSVDEQYVEESVNIHLLSDEKRSDNEALSKVKDANSYANYLVEHSGVPRREANMKALHAGNEMYNFVRIAKDALFADRWAREVEIPLCDAIIGKKKDVQAHAEEKPQEGQNASAYKASRRKLADFNVGDVVRDYYNQKLYRIKKHSKGGVSTIAELDAEGNEVGTTTMNTHNNSRYSLAEAPVKAETPTISQDSEQVSDQDNAPYTIAPAHKRQHWNSESPLDAMEARLAELKRMAAPEQVYKEFPELAAYMEERDRVFKKYGGEDKVPQDIVKAVLDKYKDVLDRYMNVSDERREECFELEDLIKERKKQQADTTEEKSQEGQADSAMLYHKEADGAADAVTSEEAAMRDALVDVMRGAGVEVVTDVEEGQRVLDEVNGGARMQAKKRALETVSAASDRQHHQTVVSSADGAKVLNNLDKLVSDYEENEKTHEKTFIGTVANALGAQRKGSKSEYATFETKNGRVVTIRLADHNATVSNFDRRGELDGISIVVSPKKSAGVTNDGEAHVVEYYYDAIKLRRADGKPLADIVRAIKQALYSGEFKDTTGLAERQEVNARELRQSVGVKMQKKPMTAEEQKHKETQLSIINDTNPAPDDYHTWVRSIDDILTLQEAIDAVLAEDPEYELSTYPDVSDDMIREALRTGRITIYSSKPIKNGVFVTPSMMQAMDYSGGTKVFSKEVPIRNVAWINTDEGQYAATSGEATPQDKEVRFFRTPDGHAYGFTVGGKIYIDPRIAKADTPIHEYTHLWSAAVRQGDAKAWADIVRLMQGTHLWDEVAQHYPELADDVDALADEVLAHFSGRRGAERLREAQRAAMEQEGLDAQAAAVAAVERVRQALKRFWRKVADFFGRRFTTAEEVADTVLADMLHGVKPAFAVNDGGVRYDANSEEAGIVARAKADGTYMKAPNGQPSKLTPRQWVQVRTKAFKEWFGDWAKRSRIEKLRKSKPIVRKGDEYKGKYELNSRSAEDYVIHSLRGEYPNNDTGDVIRITRASRKVAHHDAENEVHLRSIAYIPEMIKNAVFIEESPNEKGSKFDSYRYYVVGLKIGGVDYTAKLVVGVKDGDSYYDHSLTEIEKNNLIDLTNGVKADVSGNEAAPFTGKDKRLLSILQTDCSKVVDENGEPRVVYHGTQEEFNAFDKDAVRERGDGVKGFFFATAARRESVAGYYAQDGGSIMPVFLNLKRPLVRSTSETLEAPGIADGYDGIISTAASDAESRYYDYEQKRVATERLNKGDIVEIVAFEPSQIKSATDNVGTFDGENPDIRYQKSTDLFSEYGDRWLLEQTNDDGRHTTQVTTTIQSYKKFSEFVKRDSRGAEVDVLDASSGLGHGTEWMRSNGMRVDDVEPYPSSNRKKPTYSSYDDVKKKYDYIISNAVLNVIPDDWRSDLLHNMADKLKPGGKLVINVRGAESIRRQGKDGVTRITLDDASEILVLRPDGSIKAYQKGFTKDELQAWCEDELGEGYTVLKANKENAGGTYDTAVVVIKNNESTTKGSASELGQPTDKGAAVANFGAMIGNNSERSKRLSDLSLEISKTGALGSHQLLHGLNVALDLSVTTKEGGRMSTDRSRYYDLGSGVSLRVSDHQGNADTFARVGHPVDNYGIVIKLSRSRFKDKDGVDYLEYVYYGDRVDGRRRQMEIVDGLRAFVETGDFSKLPRADKVNGSGRFKDAALPQQTERSSSAKRLVVEELAEKLHTNINIIDDVNEITHPNSAVQERRRKSKGWYDMRTGQAYIVLPNNRNVEDVAATVFHETVGHKGLRELIGEDNYNDFLREVYGHVKVDVRRRIAKLASNHNWDFDKATDEYLSGLAEKDFEDFDREERSVWQWLKEKVLKAIDKFLGSLKLPKWVKLGDNELRYMLWRSKERLERGKEHPIDLARDIVKREELGIGEDYAVYRDPDETLRNASERASDEAGMDVLLREGEEEDAASDTSGEQMQGGVAATRDALRARALQEHAVHQQDFQRKLDAIGRQMGKLRQALAAQRAYDKSTVGILSGLARTMLKLGMLDKMSPSEESRLLTLMNAANGKADLTKEVDDLFDLMTKNLLRVSTTSAFQTTSDEGMPVCGRCPAGMRLKETDEMLGIFEAETLADEGDGQRFVVQQLLGMGQKMVGDDVLGSTTGFHAHQVSEISARQAAFIREISYRGQPFALGFRGDVIIEQV